MTDDGRTGVIEALVIIFSIIYLGWFFLHPETVGIGVIVDILTQLPPPETLGPFGQVGAAIATILGGGTIGRKIYRRY